MIRILTLATALLTVGCSKEYALETRVDVNGADVPTIEVAPKLLDYGMLAADESGLATFTITNVGLLDLQLGGLVLGGSSSFTIVEGPDAPMILEPEVQVSVDVAYTPSTESDQGYVIVLSDDPERPEEQVDFLGGWAVPRIEIDPMTMDFGLIPPLCGEIQPITIRSVGTGTLVVDSITFSGDSLVMVEAPALPLELPPGEQVAVNIQFLPQTEGLFVGSMQVSSNDPAGAISSTVLGTGQEGSDCEGMMTYDLEFEVDYKVADIAFLIDTTCSMSGTVNAMAGEFIEISGELKAEIPDVTFGVAQYDDYNHLGFGSGSDKPFLLLQQQTDDVAVVQNVLDNDIALHSGNDWEESTMEALFQAASGQGYDQDCDGVYDSVDDVKPFIANPYDAFFGAVGGLYNAAVPGTGEYGGMGFREDVLPIFIYATDAPLRDPDAGYATPGGCLFDASFFDVYTAIDALNGKMIGIGVNMTPDVSAGWDQMEELAIVTDSLGDMDGDTVDEPAVVAWSGTNADFRTKVVEAVLGLTGNAHFDKVALVVADDPNGLVVDIDPEAYFDMSAGEPIDFTLTIDGTVVEDPETVGAEPVLLHLVADDVLILAIETLFIVP